MSYLDAEALRRAILEGRDRRPEAAADLVRRTLAQHGLSADSLPGGGPVDLSGGLPGGLPGGFPGGLPGGPVPHPARDRLSFACAAGSRDYVLRRPDHGAVGGLVLMLHGCTQTPEDFAAGTRMGEAAAARGLATVWPAQARGANAQTCWNWFSPGDQRRGRGEPAILAELVLHIAEAEAVPRDRIFAAGLSAGAAMAVILGQTYPEVFAGVAAHSGLPLGCARDLPQAFAAMRGDAVAATASVSPAPTPTMVFHGSADTTVAPSNGDRILRDVLAATPGPQTQTVQSGTAGGRAFRQVTTLGAGGAVLAEQWQVEGLGHAWSGGDRAGSYADPAGPDASAEMLRFFLSLGDGAS